MTPQPGAGIGVRTGNGLVAFDYDDDEAALSISPHFPESPVNKAGQTAWTGFIALIFRFHRKTFSTATVTRFWKYSLMGARQWCRRPSIPTPKNHTDTSTGAVFRMSRRLSYRRCRGRHFFSVGGFFIRFRPALCYRVR